MSEVAFVAPAPPWADVRVQAKCDEGADRNKRSGAPQRRLTACASRGRPPLPILRHPQATSVLLSAARRSTPTDSRAHGRPHGRRPYRPELSHTPSSALSLGTRLAQADLSASLHREKGSSIRIGTDIGGSIPPADQHGYQCAAVYHMSACSPCPQACRLRSTRATCTCSRVCGPIRWELATARHALSLCSQ
jgi:hypothetical protein